MSRLKSQQARRRTNLWRKDPHCFWCGCLTVLPTGQLSGKVPSNIATLEHILSRNVRLPGEVFPDGANTVLACFGCNGARNDEELASIPIEERRKAAQNGHSKRGLTSPAQVLQCAPS